MSGVRFITVTELCKHATAVVTDAEKNSYQIVITKKGKPVALLAKVERNTIGKSESVTKFKNNAIAMIEAVEAGKSFIITRDEEPVAKLSRITASDFRIAK